MHSSQINYCRKGIGKVFHLRGTKLTLVERFMSLRTKVTPINSRIHWLERRQYKNELVSIKRKLVLKLPPFFSYLQGKGKKPPISKQTCVSQKRFRSYIVLALVVLINWLIFTSCVGLYLRYFDVVTIFLHGPKAHLR